MSREIKDLFGTRGNQLSRSASSLVEAATDYLKRNRYLFNHPSLTHLLQSVGETASEHNGHVAEWRGLGEKILRLFVSLDAKNELGPRELANVWYWTDRLGISETGLFRKLRTLTSQKTTYHPELFSAQDISQILRALGSMFNRAGQNIWKSAETRDLFKRLGTCFNENQGSWTDKYIANVTTGFGMVNAVHSELFSSMATEMTTLLAQRAAAHDVNPDPNERPFLSVLGCAINVEHGFATVNFEAPQLLDTIEEILVQHAQPTCDQPVPLKMIALHLWSSAAFGREVDPTVLDNFLARLPSEWETSSDDDKKRLFDLGASGVLAQTGVLPAIWQGWFDSYRQLYPLSEDGGGGVFENHVADLLNRLGFTEAQHGTELTEWSFKRGHIIGPYELDFLVMLPSGTKVNVEADGFLFHGIPDVAESQEADSYPNTSRNRGGNCVRDSVLKKLGVSTVRVPSEEFYSQSFFERSHGLAVKLNLDVRIS